ncbi:hypothetical protein AHAS_Ahas13G0509400 [Arachis hypogaea]
MEQENRTEKQCIKNCKYSGYEDEDATSTNLGHSSYEDKEETMVLAVVIGQRLQKGLLDGGSAFKNGGFYDGELKGDSGRPWIMATTMSLSLSHTSFLHQNPSLCSKRSQFPHLTLILRNQPTSSLSLSVSTKRDNGVVPKATGGVLESSSNSPISAKNSTDPIVVIDNYDSFTYNLCQYMGELGFQFDVYRNDELTVEELKKKNPRGVLISPGPGTPQDSGISLQTVLELGPTVPLFGVCMGLQCIGEAFGGVSSKISSTFSHH